MNREIKFKVYLILKDKVDFFGIERLNGNKWENTCFEFNPKEYFRWNSGTFNLDLNKGSRFERKQFTGLKDKNGKEIYEGDIVEVIDEPYSSRLNRPTKFLVEWKDGYYPNITYSLIHSIEVLGNIFENPKLLK